MEDGKRSQERANTIEFKKDKIEALQDNMQMHYLQMGRKDAQTHWPKGGTPLSVAQLTVRLIAFLKMNKGKPVPGKSKTTTHEQKQQPVVGTLISKVKQIEIKNIKKIEDFNVECLLGFQSLLLPTFSNPPHNHY